MSIFSNMVGNEQTVVTLITVVVLLLLVFMIFMGISQIISLIRAGRQIDVLSDIEEKLDVMADKHRHVSQITEVPEQVAALALPYDEYMEKYFMGIERDPVPVRPGEKKFSKPIPDEPPTGGSSLHWDGLDEDEVIEPAEPKVTETTEPEAATTEPETAATMTEAKAEPAKGSEPVGGKAEAITKEELELPDFFEVAPAPKTDFGAPAENQEKLNNLEIPSFMRKGQVMDFDFGQGIDEEPAEAEEPVAPAQTEEPAAPAVEDEPIEEAAPAKAKEETAIADEVKPAEPIAPAVPKAPVVQPEPSVRTPAPSNIDSEDLKVALEDLGFHIPAENPYPDAPATDLSAYLDLQSQTPSPTEREQAVTTVEEILASMSRDLGRTPKTGLENIIGHASPAAEEPPTDVYDISDTGRSGKHYTIDELQAQIRE